MPRALSRLLAVLLLAAVLSACSNNTSAPTEADARAAVEQEIKDFSQGCIQLVAFQKTGEKVLGSVMLVNATVTIEFLEDCNWPMDTMFVVARLVPGATPGVIKGERRTVHRTRQFQKTDRGWKASQMNDPGSKPTQ